MDDDFNVSSVAADWQQVHFFQFLSFVRYTSVQFFVYLSAVERKKSEITMEVGGWVQVSLGIFLGKSSQNSSKPVQIFGSSIPYVYTLLKVVSYYDLSVLSMSVIGLQKKVWMGWVGGWVSSIQVFFGFFNFAKPLLPNRWYFAKCS